MCFHYFSAELVEKQLKLRSWTGFTAPLQTANMAHMWTRAAEWSLLLTQVWSSSEWKLVLMNSTWAVKKDAHLVLLESRAEKEMENGGPGANKGFIVLV